MGDGVIGSPQAFGALQSRFESESPSSRGQHRTAARERSTKRKRCLSVPDDAFAPRAAGALGPLAVLVLAAGAGTRMKSRTPKVLHGFAGRSLLGHVLAAADPLRAQHTVVVVGAGREQVVPHLEQVAPAATALVQEQQGGTGHATRLALDAVPADASGT